MGTGFIVELEPRCRQTEYKLSGATTWLNHLFYFQLEHLLLACQDAQKKLQQ